MHTETDEFLAGFAHGLFRLDYIQSPDGTECVEPSGLFALYEETAEAALVREVRENQALREYVSPLVAMFSEMTARSSGDMFDAGFNFAWDAWDASSFATWTYDADDCDRILEALDYDDWFSRYEFWAEPNHDGAIMPRFDFL